jgi:hypothetical protein
VTPLQRELIDAGLMRVFGAAQAMVAETRLRLGTNDIVIAVFVNDEGPTKLYGKTRMRVLDLIKEALPDAHDTRVRLEEGGLPPDRFLLLIVHKQSLYILDLPIPAGTTGVLN